MAHKKGAGSTRNGRDSESKRLGVKLYGGQIAISGNIIIRQRGTQFHPGEGVGMGKDHTIFAKTDGVVSFRKKRNNRRYVSVIPMDAVTTVEAPKPEKPKAKKVEAPKVEAPKVEAPKEEKPAKKAPAAKVEAPADVDAAKAQLLEKIGEGSADDKDDLKKISGVGPVLEKTLNEMGIYKYAQVAKMTKPEYDLLDSLTGKFPGRAERDDWAGQATELMKG